MSTLNTVARHVANALGSLDHWLIATFIALLVSLGTAGLIHGIEKHDERLHTAEERMIFLEQRVLDIEQQRIAATAKRYTSDDAARDKKVLLSCIKDRAKCPTD